MDDDFAGPEVEAEISFDDMVDEAPSVSPKPEDRPCYRAYGEWVEVDGKRKPPGTYHHTMSEETAKCPSVPVDTRIAGPVWLDALKLGAKRNYGVPIRAFLEKLTRDEQDLGELLEIAKSDPAFSQQQGEQEARVAARFAMIGMAGELAIEYGIVPWPEGSALDAAVTAFKAWLGFRGVGNDEPRKIRQAIREFLERHGGSRFIDDHGTCVSDESRAGDRSVRERAGYRGGRVEGSGADQVASTLYLFNSAGLKEATQGFDLATIKDVLTECGALERDPNTGHPTQQRKIHGQNGRYYVINPEKLEG